MVCAGAAGGVAVEGTGLPSTEGDASCVGDGGAASSSTGAGDTASPRGKKTSEELGEAVGPVDGPGEPGAGARTGQRKRKTKKERKKTKKKKRKK